MIEGARKSCTSPELRATAEDAANTEVRPVARPMCIISVSVDAVADHALRARQASEATEVCCDVCDVPLPDEPAGHGLYVWYRGDEIRIEEPALCCGCATAIGVTALSAWDAEEEEG